MKALNIAIVGATGLVGQMFLKILEEEDMNIKSLSLFASMKSLGKTLNFKGNAIPIQTLHQGCFKSIDIVLMSVDSDISKKVAIQAIEEGAIVIDNSSAFRNDPRIPLVVPEINLKSAYNHRLIANPNCSTIQSVLVLKALKDAYGIEDVLYVTLQAVSGSGQKGLDDLTHNSAQFYPYKIKETTIPLIGNILENLYTEEEMKMVNETKKILNQSDLNIHATCIRVPVEYGHGVHITVTLKKAATVKEIKSRFSKFPGIEVLDDPIENKVPTSIAAVGNDSVYVGRIKQDLNHPLRFSMYVVGDNLRKGAALNAIQIMKGLIDYEYTR